MQKQNNEAEFKTFCHRFPNALICYRQFASKINFVQSDIIEAEAAVRNFRDYFDLFI